VERHERGIARERVAPATTTRGVNADEGARGNRFIVHQPFEYAFTRTARVHRDAEWLARTATLQAPTAQDRPIGYRQEGAVDQGADLLAVAKAAAVQASAPRIRR